MNGGTEQGTASLPLMARAWWWDAVSAPVGKEWIRIVARDEQGNEVATLPCQVTRRGPFSAFLLPQLTQTSHISVSPSADRHEAMAQMVAALKKEMHTRHAIIAQVADYLTDDDKATLSAEGFTLEERVSYRIEPDDIDAVIKRFHSDKRRTLRKAKGLSLDPDMAPDELFSAIEKAYGTADYPRNLFTSLATAAIENDCGVILRAKDQSGADAAALLLVHDERIAYYLAYAIAPAHRSDGAMEWLTVEAMKYAFSRGLTFDFEGSIIPNIARTYRHYGGQPAHYVLATLYANPLVKFALKTLTKLRKG